MVSYMESHLIRITNIYLMFKLRYLRFHVNNLVCIVYVYDHHGNQEQEGCGAHAPFYYPPCDESRNHFLSLQSVERFHLHWQKRHLMPIFTQNLAKSLTNSRDFANIRTKSRKISHKISLFCQYSLKSRKITQKISRFSTYISCVVPISDKAVVRKDCNFS